MIGFSMRIGNPLRRVESANESRLEYIQGGGVVSLFGMPFLGAGLFSFCLLIFGLIPKLFQMPVAVSQLPIVAMAFLTFLGCGCSSPLPEHPSYRPNWSRLRQGIGYRHDMVEHSVVAIIN